MLSPEVVDFSFELCHFKIVLQLDSLLVQLEVIEFRSQLLVFFFEVLDFIVSFTPPILLNGHLLFDYVLEVGQLTFEVDFLTVQLLYLLILHV